MRTHDMQHVIGPNRVSTGRERHVNVLNGVNLAYLVAQSW